jgi:hypothetical protein
LVQPFEGAGSELDVHAACELAGAEPGTRSSVEETTGESVGG